MLIDLLHAELLLWVMLPGLLVVTAEVVMVTQYMAAYQQEQPSGIHGTPSVIITFVVIYRLLVNEI